MSRRRTAAVARTKRGFKLIDKVPSSRQIQRSYDRWSLCYDALAAPRENGPRRRGIEAADLQPGEIVLDVGVGTGAIRITSPVAPNQARATIYGVDVSVRMLARARRKIAAADSSGATLIAGDARALPFSNETFDVVYSAYTLDLLSLADISIALAEFRRVLKQDGRLILVNMSKEYAGRLGWFELMYRRCPRRWWHTFAADAVPSCSSKRDSATSTGSSSGMCFPLKS